AAGVNKARQPYSIDCSVHDIPRGQWIPAALGATSPMRVRVAPDLLDLDEALIGRAKYALLPPFAIGANEFGPPVPGTNPDEKIADPRANCINADHHCDLPFTGFFASPQPVGLDPGQ